MIKKNLLLLGLALTFSLLSISSAQALSPIRFGVKAGFQGQSLNMHPKNVGDLLSSDGNGGYLVGAMMRVSLGVVPLYIQPEVVYSHSSYTMKDETAAASAKYAVNNIEVPVLLGYKIFFLRLMAGPTFNLMNKTNVKSGTLPSGLNTDLDKYALGYQVGLGVELLKHLNIDLRYDGQFKQATQSITYGDVMEQFKTSVNTVQVNVGWMF